MDIVVYIAVALVAAAVGAALGYQRKGEDLTLKARATEDELARLRAHAQVEVENLLKKSELEAKEFSIRERQKVEEEGRQVRHDMQEWERRLRQREEGLDKRGELVDRKEAEVQDKERQLQLRSEQLDKQSDELKALSGSMEERLSHLAELSRDDARVQVLERVENDARLDIARRLKTLEEEARSTADRKARRIIALAIQRFAGEYVTEKTVSVVTLPNEEMKGRIIGREGRNIRAIEAATGVDLIIDDTPEAVIISSFNPMRREVARISLERLIADGRIHPTRIEEVVKKVEEEVEAQVREAGEQAAFELGLNGIHAEILRLVGSLKFRTSYGQNQYRHALEVAHLAGLMAAELGLNPKHARRAGLLHDIGKVIDQSVEGSHAVIGAEFARKHGESARIVNAIASHHEEVPMESIYAVLVQAADALSGARPGARREILESYIKRLEDLERISNAFDGVEKSYAIQAGREVRIVVSNNSISDAEAVMLSRNIARKIEGELTYPGQIKVTVIRETRAVDFAR